MDHEIRRQAMDGPACSHGMGPGHGSSMQPGYGSDPSNPYPAWVGWVPQTPTSRKKAQEKSISSESEIDDAVDYGGREAIETEHEEDEENDDAEGGDDVPLVVLPEDVPESLERVEEPKERGVRTTADSNKH